MNELKRPILADGWMYYDLELNPEPWAVGPVGVKRSGSRMTPYIGRNVQLREYQDAIREQLEEYSTLEMPGMYLARYFFWRRRDEYVSEKMRKVRRNEVDLTNLVKATEDACQKVLFGNDIDCVGHKNYFFQQDTESHTRVVIGVQPVTFRPDPVAVMHPDLVKQLEFLRE